MIKEMQDEQGMTRRYLFPDGVGVINFDEGIPLDCYDDIAEAYEDAPPSFVVRLCNALYGVGLVERSDFLGPGATGLYGRALRTALKHDAFKVINHLKELHNA